MSWRYLLVEDASGVPRGFRRPNALRRNHYTINAQLPLPEAIARGRSTGALLSILTATHASERPSSRL